jgi:hypothetical protein
LLEGVVPARVGSCAVLTRPRSSRFSDRVRPEGSVIAEAKPVSGENPYVGVIVRVPSFGFELARPMEVRRPPQSTPPVTPQGEAFGHVFEGEDLLDAAMSGMDGKVGTNRAGPSSLAERRPTEPARDECALSVLGASAVGPPTETVAEGL